MFLLIKILGFKISFSFPFYFLEIEGRILESNLMLISVQNFTGYLGSYLISLWWNPYQITMFFFAIWGSNVNIHLLLEIWIIACFVAHSTLILLCVLETLSSSSSLWWNPYRITMFFLQYEVLMTIYICYSRFG